MAQVTSSPGRDMDPNLSPDGSLIAYSSNQNGGFEICVKSLAPGSKVLQLTSDGGQNFQPAWSPDGKLIAYYSQKRGGIWLIPALGGSARLLVDFGSRPSWSPDGTKIAFQSAESPDLGQTIAAGPMASTIWAVPAQGGEPIQLTQANRPPGTHYDPIWSPDGKRILFTTGILPAPGFWSVPANGGEPHLLLSTNGFGPVYAPNGRALYFSLSKGMSWHLMRVNLTGSGDVAGEPETMENTGKVLFSHLRFSADGRTAVFSQASTVNSVQSVRIAPATAEPTGPPEALTQDTNGRKITPIFSPDGKMIAYNTFQFGVGEGTWLVDPDGKNGRQLDAAPYWGILAGWLPGSRRIGYFGRDKDHTFLELLDIDSGKKERLRELAPTDFFPRLSPEGKQLAFFRTQNGVMNLWVEPTEGGAAKQLTFDKQGIGFPTWARDGRSIAAEMKRDGGTQIVVIPSEGGTPLQLTNDPGENWPRDFSPDGDKIAFAGLRQGVWNIYWVSRHNRAEKQITNSAKANAFLRYPSWSPRGDQIVYEYSETVGNIWLMRVK